MYSILVGENVCSISTKDEKMSKNSLFEEYFQTYKDQVIRFTMSRGGDYEIAQEISQQVFCAFYICMDKIEPDYVKAWLFRSAQNALIDHMRKSSVRKEVSLEDRSLRNESILAEDGSVYCENRLIYEELIGRILREVRSANEIFYEVLLMICVDGMSYKEAAEKLNVSEQVVRTRLSRARKYVREKYGDEYWGDK